MKILTHKISGVYQIVNTINGHRYIGSSVDIHKRWSEHKWKLTNNKHHCRHLQSAWNKYGADAFLFSILEQCNKDRLIEREQFCLDTLRPEYNASPTAGTKFGWKMSEDVKRKIGEAHIGNKAWLGRKHTQASKDKVSAAKKGKPSSLRGTSRSQEVKDKISQSNKGKKRSIDALIRLSLAHIGNKSGHGNKGRITSEETKRKMSIAMKNVWANKKDGQK